MAAELNIFPSKFSLPSFDPDCLSALVYSKFGNAKLEVQDGSFTRFGFLSNRACAPCLKRKDGDNVHSVEGIIDTLREMKFGTDFHLSQKECADSEAFIEFMNSKLRPAVMHTYWIEEGNYEEVTREAYATLFPLPAAMFYPRWRRQGISNYIYTSNGGNMNFQSQTEIENKIYSDAVFCLNQLSEKLNTHPYLFGNTPTTADALMFGYLAPIMKMPFVGNRLREHLNKYTNITNTINHILKTYFHDKTIKPEKNETNKEMDEEFPNQVRNTYIAVVFGLSVLVSYAFLRGGFSIVVMDDPVDV